MNFRNNEYIVFIMIIHNHLTIKINQCHKLDNILQFYEPAFQIYNNHLIESFITKFLKKLEVVRNSPSCFRSRSLQYVTNQQTIVLINESKKK